MASKLFEEVDSLEGANEQAHMTRKSRIMRQQACMRGVSDGFGSEFVRE